jgi:hypothetical protein
VRRPPHSFAAALIAAATLTLVACGSSDRSTLPPPPSGAARFVPLARLARFPEVYADAQIASAGTVARGGPSGFELTAPGITTQVALDPARLAAPYLGRSVETRGTFTVSFQGGYEILLASIGPSAGNSNAGR